MNFAIDNTALALPEAGAGAHVNPVVRVLPSLTDMAVILTLVFLFTCMGGTHSLLGDGDTGWHIRTGQWILANHKVPHSDIFSYTMPGTPWFAWEWLWDTAFAGIYNVSGLAGVALVNLLVICVTMALLFQLTRRKCDNVWSPSSRRSPSPVPPCAAGSPAPVHIAVRRDLLWMLECQRSPGRDGAREGCLYPAGPLVLWTNLHAGFLWE
jgi:hypothetical protein